MSTLAAIVAFLKSIPALAKFGEWLGETIKAYDQKRNEAEAARRHAEKDRAVDERLRELDRVRSSSSTAEQQRTSDESAGLSSSSDSGS